MLLGQQPRGRPGSGDLQREYSLLDRPRSSGGGRQANLGTAWPEGGEYSPYVQRQGVGRELVAFAAAKTPHLDLFSPAPPRLLQSGDDGPGLDLESDRPFQPARSQS